MIKPNLSQQKNHLRQTLKKQRATAINSHKRRLEHTLVTAIYPWIKKHKKTKNVAVFKPMAQEVPIDRLIDTLRHKKFKLFLPVVRHGHLDFVPCRWGKQHYSHHALGMKEPKSKRAVPFSTLDFIVVPLLGFTAKGDRLGLGGGFYDRTLGQKFARTLMKVGVALEAQKCRTIPMEKWDIQLHQILTEKNRYRGRAPTKKMGQNHN